MARVEVPMPQMGESIAEGTVSKWLKQVGDDVDRDEPILEISTDKVDAEIPSPTAGTLVEIAVQEGQTVEVGTIVAFIETEKGAVAGNGGKAPAPAEPEEEEEEEEASPAEEPAEAPPAKTAAKAEGTKTAAKAESAQPAAAKTAPAPAGEDESADERLRRRSTPLVRRIAEEHGVDIAEVEGSGRAGRVTKQDIMSYLETREAEPAEKA
ncbi:MAG TPA: biotin/lipoyl-containing protein, partial [Longimicrobiales bacterium]|nr:biotin/lipoyl-containing protein [Longimicrobiales bacterium]